MPLEKGSSRAVMSHNISEMVKVGHPQKQAVAAAYREAGEPRRASDMNRSDFRGLLSGLIKFFTEEQQEPAHSEDDAHGTLNEHEESEAGKSHKEREEQPADVFLMPTERKYPVKTKQDGEWKYSRDLLLAAARRARMQGKEELASRADNIRKREFESGAEDSMPFAFDRESVRDKDADGRLHVAQTNISKANVCPYLGREIPDFEGLGLDPEKKYRLLRHPDELKKAVGTFNNLPVLSEHVPVSAADHRPDLVIGSTGTDATYDHPYLQNSLVIWPEDYINRIEKNRQKELSSAYRYRADMTPGTYEGEAYDGVMRDIIGNHVALVPEGRVGHDVVVGDSKENTMPKALTRKAAMVMGAVRGFIAPKMATDAKIDLTPIFAGVTSKNYAEKQPAIIEGVKKVVVGKLATDAKMDGEGLKNLLECFKAEEPQEDAMSTMPNSGSMTGGMMDPEEEGSMDAEEPPMHGKLREFLKDKLSAEDMAACDEIIDEKDERDEEEEEHAEGEDEDMSGAEDDPPPFKGMPKKGGTMDRHARDRRMGKDRHAKDRYMGKDNRHGMDAAIIESRVMTRIRAVKDAENYVRPKVGTIAIACDSADEVFRAALKIRGIDASKVRDSAALKAMVDMLPAHVGQQNRVQPVPAMDSTSPLAFDKMFAGAASVRILG